MPPVKATKPVKTLECKKNKHDYVFQENNFLKNVSGTNLQCLAISSWYISDGMPTGTNLYYGIVPQDNALLLRV